MPEFYFLSLFPLTDMSSQSNEHDCKCQCLPHIHTYREDQGICVDEIRGKWKLWNNFLHLDPKKLVRK